jgi:HlyD family secretion protein
MEKLFSGKRIGKIKNYIVVHKAVSATILILVIIFGYWGYTKIFSTPQETSYVLGKVEKGTLVLSVTGSGQVSALNQFDVKSKGSGDVVYLGVTQGQIVKADTLIAELDATNAEKTVRDAEANLQSAKLSLQKLEEPADLLSVTQAENALTQANSSLQKAYDDGFNTISNTFLDLPGVMSGLQDILYGITVSHGTQDNVSAYADMVKNYDSKASLFKDDAVREYQAARTAYDTTISDYKTANRVSSTTTIESLVNETYNTTKTIAEAVKSSSDLLNFVKDTLIRQQLAIPTILTTHQNSLANYTGQTNTDLLNLYNIKNTILTSSQSITEKTEALAKLKAGADPLDVTSGQLSITQRQNALTDAQNALADYYIRAPFDGTIAKLNVKKFDSVSPSTAVATLTTKEQIAQISVNEVDAAKIKPGQEVTLTFDAVDGLTITGKVIQIDTIGTVSQGVVTYNVEISFDTGDDRIKPGMSVSAAIITDIKQDALLVPNSAVKNQGDNYYVEVFPQGLTVSGTAGNQGTPSATLPGQQPIEIGSSNDTSTEIISGLKEGDQVVVRTISASATSAATAPSLFGAVGGNRGGSGAVRIPSGR